MKGRRASGPAGTGGATVMGMIQGIGRALAALAVGLALVAAATARAQDLGLGDDEAEQVESEATRRLRQLTDPDTKDAARKKELRPPFEFYRTRVAPFDVLTYVKPNHWVTLTQELQANLADYEGRLRTAPVGLLDMPRAVVFRRDARLLEGQPMRLSWPAFLPSQARSLDIELIRPGAIRADDGTQAPLLPMMPHQMLVVVLADDPASYVIWKRYQAVIPATTDVGDQQLVDRRSYYRVVVPQEEGPPNLPTHPLTWTTISHVIWDGVDPSTLSVGQQQAMIDWLHWGGQLIIAGGAASSQALLADVESFLGPYLPGEPSADSRIVSEAELSGLSQLYPPPAWKSDRLADASTVYAESMMYGARGGRPPGRLSRYGPPDPIDLPPDRPLVLSGLSPLTDDVEWVTDDRGLRFGIERRVGRGRILMLAFDPKEAAFQRWKGNDTFVRRVLLRRAEDRWNPADPNDSFMLSGPELSWYRLLGRDLDPLRFAARRQPPRVTNPYGQPTAVDPMQDPMPEAPVAAWLDTALLPWLARQALVAASGIEVPGAPFVLRVITAYVVALVPLNWLLCRFVLRRREVAWAIVPVLALGFAVAVERAAAIDTGYDRACDEIDVLEIQPEYPRAHLSRFSVLYSTGRENFTISYPGEPSSLALPLNANLAIRGEQATESIWQSTPVPALLDFRVEPRSLAMLRAEQLVNLRGAIVLRSTPDAPRAIVNGSELDLRDAILVDVGVDPRDGGNRYTPIGAIPPGAAVPLPDFSESSSEFPPLDPSLGEGRPDWADLGAFLGPLCSYNWGRPEDAGELRLVAWAPEPRPGQELEPAVDRHRGFTLVVVHLRYGPPPSPDGPTYYSPERLSLLDPGRAGSRPDGRPTSGVDFADELLAPPESIDQ